MTRTLNMTRVRQTRVAVLLLGLCLLLRSGRALSLSEADTQEPGGGQEQRDGPLNTSSLSNHTVCLQPMKIGFCRASFQRFFYNPTNQSCRSFTWGGCGANQNNFRTSEECEDTCRGVTGPVLPDDSLAVKAPRLRADLSKVPPSSRSGAAADRETEYEADCLAPADAGFCRAAFPMFYFDGATATCQSFTYGGCRGNKNRYSTMEECLRRCSRTDVFDTRGSRRDRWTPAIFLFVTVAAVSALLLATLVIVTLRRHRLSRRPSSISDKEELLPDEPSVDTLTVPQSPKLDQDQA